MNAIYQNRSRKFFGLLFLLFSFQINGQSWQWGIRDGSWGDVANTFGREGIADMACDQHGNIYAVGNAFQFATFNNTQTGGTSTSFGWAERDAYLIKYNACGDLLWYRRMGGLGEDDASSVILDKKGRVLVMGYCSTSSYPYSFNYHIKNFGDGVHDTTVDGAVASPIFLAKFDTSGNFINVKQPLYSGKLFFDSNDNLLVLNNINGVRVDTNGTPTFSYTFVNTTPFYPSINQITVDKFDNIYLCGSFNNTVNIGPGTTLLPTPSTLIANVNSSNSLLVKFSPAGNMLWYKRGTSNSGGDGLSGMAVDTSGTRILTGGGAWNGASVFGYSVNTGVGTIANNIYLLNALNGNLISAKTGSANYQGGIAPFMATRDNEFLCKGAINGFLAFNTTTCTAVGIPGVRQNCIGKFDANGNFVYMKLVPLSGGSAYDVINAMAVDQQGSVIAAGIFSGLLGSAGTTVYPEASMDGFVARFGYGCNSDTSSLTPLAPTTLTATNQGSLSNFVNWTDNSQYETGFELWCIGGSISNYSLIATLAANTTTYNHTGLSYTTTYCYKVRAYNSTGFSVYTNIGCATTPIPQPPAAPTNLTANNTGTLNNAINWTDNSSDETNFELWCMGGNIPTFSLIVTLPANTTNYFHTGLTYTTNYCYKARAINNAGASVYTNTDCAVTPNENTTGVEQISYLSDFRMFPNPTNEIVTLQFQSTGKTAIIKIINLLGTVVKEETLNTQPGENKINLKLPENKGIYLIQIRSNTNIISGKVVLE